FIRSAWVRRAWACASGATARRPGMRCWRSRADWRGNNAEGVAPGKGEGPPIKAVLKGGNTKELAQGASVTLTRAPKEGHETCGVSYWPGHRAPPLRHHAGGSRALVRRDNEPVDPGNPPLLDPALEALAEGGLLRRVRATHTLRDVMLDVQ